MDSSSKIKNKKSKTIRLNVDLSKTDENGCAVFNYRELLKAEMDRRKKDKRNEQNGNADFDEQDMNNEDEALKKIALQYEEKYGSNTMRYQTYTELGAGYDENDSFIDNTEACEELLPDDIEPIRGGFYVNCGKLEFKTLHGQYESKKGKKRRIQDDIEDEDTSVDVKKIKDEIREKNEDVENIVSNGKTIKRIIPKQLPKLTFITEEEFEDNASKVDIKADPISTNQKNNPIVGDEKRENMNQSEVDKTENDSADTNVISNSETSNSADRDITQKEEPASLPQNLSSEIIVCINELKSQALSIGSQRKFFSDPSNIELLNSLETKCRMELNNSSRQSVYEYLSNYLPYTKSTLISKGKKIFSGADQLEPLLAKISKIKSYDSFDNYDTERKFLEESKEFIEKVIQIKVREYILKRLTKKVSFDFYLNEFFSELIKVCRNGCISVSTLQNYHYDFIKSETEAFKINYSRSISTDLLTQNQFVNLNTTENNCDLNSMSLSKDITSADDKVQMQVDQVLQDLVVLSQMSSDTSPNAK